jgi:aspartyl-tRNA(Asn)/glutamyl-tRNA(Gln) amidotransferase subunit B
MGDLLRSYKDANVDMKDLSESRVSPKKLADLILLVDAGRISGKMAKAVFEEMYQTARHPDAIIQEKGLVQISDPSEIERVVDQVIAENSKTVEQYRAGKTGTFGFFVGQVMKQTGGKANPAMLQDLIKRRLT